MFKVRNKKTYAKHVRKRPENIVKPTIKTTVSVKVEKKDTKLVDVLLEKKQILPKEEKKVEEVMAVVMEEPATTLEEVVEDENNGEETQKPATKRKPRKPKTENNETKE